MDIHAANIDVTSASQITPRFLNPVLRNVVADQTMQVRHSVFLELENTDKLHAVKTTIQVSPEFVEGLPKVSYWIFVQVELLGVQS